MVRSVSQIALHHDGVNIFIPRGSAFLNLLVRGCLSLFGKDCTKRSVCFCQLDIVRAGRSERLHVFAANGLDDIVWWCAQEFCDDGKLVHVVFPWKERFALEHLGENASSAPDVNLHVVLLPCEHDFRGAVVSCRDVAGHLRVLDAGKTEIAYFEIAVLVHKNIAGLEVAVHNASGVHIFETTLRSCQLLVKYLYSLGSSYQDLVQKVLNELFFEGSRGKQAMEVGPEEFSHKVAKGINCKLF